MVNKLIWLLIFFNLSIFTFTNIIGISIAQTQAPAQVVVPPQAQPSPTSPLPPPVEKAKDVEPKAKTAQKETVCNCIEPAVTAIQKAYTSLEEDEWPSAIKISTDALNLVSSLSKTCMCPEVNIYQNVAKAYLNYAKAGNLLDGQDEPDCVVAKKLYEDVISWLGNSIPQILNTEISANAKNIQEYAKEELQFVKEECEEKEPPPKQPQQKSTGSKQ